MEEILWKLPHIGTQTFKRLSNQSLAKCKTVRKTWYNFITNENFYKLRVYYEEVQKDKYEFGETQLHQIARDGHLSECKLIIDHVENKNPADNRGQTPLHLSAENGHLDICRLIIEKIVDKNPANNNGWTPLHDAACLGRLEVCKLIIENVDDKHPVDKYGRTPKDLVDQNYDFAVYQLFES